MTSSEVETKAEALARKIAANGPLAVQQVKRAVLAASGLPPAQAYRIEDEAKRVVTASDDAHEGALAFVEKRHPNYVGR